MGNRASELDPFRRAVTLSPPRRPFRGVSTLARDLDETLDDTTRAMLTTMDGVQHKPLPPLTPEVPQTKP